jgi:carbon starvation protein
MINGQPELQEFKLEIDEFTDQPMTTWLLDHGLSAGEIVRFRQGRVTVVDSDTARLSGSLAWNNSYQSWRDADGLAKTVGSFVEGAGNFVAALGIPRPVAVALMAVLVASFAATTLDTATRLQRYVMQELAGTIGVRPLTTKHGATLFVVLVAAALAVVPPPGSSWSEGMGKGGLLLWPLFGAVNQLLAGLAFIVVAIYLVRRKLPTWMIVPPMVLMLVTPMLAMLYQILSGWGPLAGYDAGWLMRKQYHLVGAGIAVCGLEVWMVAEAMMLWPKVRGVIEREPTPLRGFPVQVVGDGD